MNTSFVESIGRESAFVRVIGNSLLCATAALALSFIGCEDPSVNAERAPDNVAVEERARLALDDEGHFNEVSWDDVRGVAKKRYTLNLFGRRSGTNEFIISCRAEVDLLYVDADGVVKEKRYVESIECDLERVAPERNGTDPVWRQISGLVKIEAANPDGEIAEIRVNPLKSEELISKLVDRMNGKSNASARAEFERLTAKRETSGNGG